MEDWKNGKADCDGINSGSSSNSLEWINSVALRSVLVNESRSCPRSEPRARVRELSAATQSQKVTIIDILRANRMKCDAIELDDKRWECDGN